MLGELLPSVRTAIPGPKSRALVDVLARHECPAVTARRDRRAKQLGQEHDDPIVWEQAAGANVVDADGNVFVDLIAGFGVATLGHRPPEVLEAAGAQQARLLHAMGDAAPDASRIRFLEALAARAPGDLSVSMLGTSGSDAVDAAVKTAVLATGRTHVVCFDRAYHGLATGVLPLQAYKKAFTQPFRGLLADRVRHLPWGCSRDALVEGLSPGDVALVLVEPVQGRGGMHAPADGWLAMVADQARCAGALVAFDEIQCGLGRTGHWWACEHDEVVPDLLCAGKALGGGYPISACIGSSATMSAWGASTGEALHTQTFLGHPVACAAGLAALGAMEACDLPGMARRSSEHVRSALHERGFSTRGRGLMLGIDIGTDALSSCRALLERGFITLPAGPSSLGLTPPATVTIEQWDAFVTALVEVCT